MSHIEGESEININPQHKGRFTTYCESKGYDKVTTGCINEGLKDSDPHIRKEANFARNAEKWHHSKK